MKTKRVDEKESKPLSQSELKEWLVAIDIKIMMLEIEAKVLKKRIEISPGSDYLMDRLAVDWGIIDELEAKRKEMTGH